MHRNSQAALAERPVRLHDRVTETWPANYQVAPVEVTAPARNPCAPAMEIDRVYDRRAMATAPSNFQSGPAKVIGRVFTRLGTAIVQDVLRAMATAPSNSQSGPGMVIDQESAILIDHRSRDLRSHVYQVGVHQATGPRDGGHQFIVRPWRARPFGTRGIVQGIVHRGTGGAP